MDLAKVHQVEVQALLVEAALVHQVEAALVLQVEALVQVDLLTVATTRSQKTKETRTKTRNVISQTELGCNCQKSLLKISMDGENVHKILLLICLQKLTEVKTLTSTTLTLKTMMDQPNNSAKFVFRLSEMQVIQSVNMSISISGRKI